MSESIKTSSYNKQLKGIFWLFLILAGIELINLLTGRILNQFGNLPRDLMSLPGIFIGPLLHGSLWHFTSNIIPLCIFTFLMLQHGTKRFWVVTFWIVFTTGLLVWLFARQAYHVGASGVIYGYFGYLILAGFLAKQLKLILISVLVGLFYGGMIFGILPARPYISWESHLFGFLSGLIAAKLWARK